MVADKRIKCILCGNDSKFSVVARKDQIRFQCLGYDKRVLECNCCGLVFLSPPWEEEDIRKLYQDYFNHVADFPGQVRKGTAAKYVADYSRCYDSILEIGCGSGETVKYLLETGHKVKGIDIDTKYCDNIHLLHYDYRDYKAKVDFIYALQVMEHMTNPFLFVKRIITMLKPKGRFLLEIPSIEDPLLTIYRNRNFSNFFYYPYHSYFYSPKTASKIISRYTSNFKVRRTQRYGIWNHLRWIIKGVPGNENPYIPILDDVYKFILVHIFRVSDTILIIGEKK